MNVEMIVVEQLGGFCPLVTIAYTLQSICTQLHIKGSTPAKKFTRNLSNLQDPWNFPGAIWHLLNDLIIPNYYVITNFSYEWKWSTRFTNKGLLYMYFVLESSGDVN